MVWRLSLLILVVALAAPGVARAGPVFESGIVSYGYWWGWFTLGRG